MNLKLLKSKLYEEIIDDFNKNKDVYMFYLSPIIFKLKTKDFSNYKYSLFSKIKNKELTTFKHYKLNKYLKKDYEKDLRTIIKIVLKSDYIDKNNKYALFHIKKILSRKSKLCYINLIYRLLTDINKIPGGAGLNFNFNKAYVSAASKASNLYNTYLKSASKPLFDLPKDKLNKLYYKYYDKYYDNFKNTIFKEYANDDDFVTTIIITYPDTDINEIITYPDTDIYEIINNIIGYNDIKSKINITDNFIKSYKMLNSYNYSINFEELFKDIYTHNINFPASINKLLYTESPVLHTYNNTKHFELENENKIIIKSYNDLYKLINKFDIFLHNKILIIFGYYYNLILYDYINIFNISNDKIQQYVQIESENIKEYSNIFNDENKLYYTAFIIFYSYIYNLNALNTYINENKFFNKSQITYDEYLKNRKIIDRIIKYIDEDIIETYDKLYDNIYDSSILKLELNDLIEIYIYKKFIITNNIIFTNTDELVNANYSILLKLYMKANCDYLLLIMSKFNITSNKIYNKITPVLQFFKIYSKLYINLELNDSISNEDINNYMIENLNQEFHNFKHFNITTKEYIDASVVDIYYKYHKFIQDIDNFLSINTDLKIEKLALFKNLIYETNIKKFKDYIDDNINGFEINTFDIPPNSDKILNIQKEIINIIILRIKEFNIAEIREYIEKYDLLPSTIKQIFKDLYKLYEKIIKLYNNFLTDKIINKIINKIIESIDISKLDSETFLIYTQEKLEPFKANISILKEKLRNKTFDSEFYNLKSKIINTYNTYNTYLYKVAMNKTIDKIKQITLDKKILQDIEEFEAKASADEYNKVIVAYNNFIIDLNKTIIKSNNTITDMKYLEQSSNEISKEDEINKEIMNYNKEISINEQQKQGGNSQLQNDKLELLLSNIYKNIKLISI